MGQNQLTLIIGVEVGEEVGCVAVSSACNTENPDISKDWEMAPYLTTFRMSRKNASFAEVQKFLPYMAICKTIVVVKCFK